MLSISKPLSAESAEKYYDRDEYYLDAPGEWGGKMSKVFGLEGTIEKQDFKSFLRGFGRNGEKLVASAGSVDKDGKSKHLSGVDLTFSAPKSVSLLSYQDKNIEKAFNEALEKTLSHIEDEFVRTRLKSKGKIKLKKTDKLLFAKFMHRTSRELDPQLHAHCIAFNMTKGGKNDKIRTMLNSEIFKNKMYLGQFFRNELANSIEKAGYSVKVTDRKQGFFEIDGVDKEVLDEFSKRREQVEAEVKKLKNLKFKDLPNEEIVKIASESVSGASLKSEIKRLSNSGEFVYKNLSDAELAEKAVLKTRIRKKSVIKKVIDDAIETALSKKDTNLNDMVDSCKKIKTEKYREEKVNIRKIVENALEDVTEQQGGFDKFALYKQALKLGLGKVKIEDIQKTFKEMERTKDIVKLGNIKSYGGKTPIYSSKSMIEAERNIMKMCKVGIGGTNIKIDKTETEKFIEKTNTKLKANSAFKIPRNEKDAKENELEFLYNISDVEEPLKTDLVEFRKVLIERGGADDNSLELIEENPKIKEFVNGGMGFTPGQKDAVKQIASTDCKYSVIQGDAGTGKSFSMLFAAKMLKEKGFDVKGFAPTGKAANELKNAAKIESGTIDSFLLKFENADEQKRKQMFNKNKECWVVDESGMAGSKKVERFMRVAEYAGAKVIFVGDRKQFASIEAGKIFSELQDKAGIDMTIMPDVMRQETAQTKAIVNAVNLNDTEFAFHAMEGKSEAEFNKKKVKNYEKGQVILFKENVGEIGEGVEAKVIGKKHDIIQIEITDFETGLPKIVDLNVKKFANSFSVLEGGKFENVIEEETDRDKRLKKITLDYLDHTKKGIGTMVITGTNKDRKELNELIRDGMIRRGNITESFEFDVFESASVGGTDVRFAGSYSPGQILFTNEKVGNIPRGTQCNIERIDEDTNKISVKYWSKKQGKYTTEEIDLAEECKKINVFNSNKKQFGVNDQIVFLKNDDRIGVQNGQVGKVTGIDQDGNCTVMIDKKQKVEFNISNRGGRAYNYVDHAFALSEYKSQGATVDRLVWHAPSGGQITSNSFYVAITRCKKMVAVYTDDVKTLKKKVLNKQEKISTLDFDVDSANKKKTKQSVVEKANALSMILSTSMSSFFSKKKSKEKNGVDI